jgi:cation:H+ antiporter
MNQLIIQVLLLMAGLICLIVGAEGLIRGGRSIGLRLGLTPLFVGLTIIAFGTSMPELVVSIGAAMQGKGDISVANVVGSNIFNIAFILGITALITPVNVYLAVIKTDIPLMIAVSMVAFWLVLEAPITKTTGFILVAALCAYTALAYYQAQKETGAVPEFGIPLAAPASVGTWSKDIVYIICGIAALLLGSKLFVDSASFIAHKVGVSEAVIGLTVVAAGTSMPELATSIVAAVRRQPDLAVGNVVGSNIFNILGIIGITAIITPLSAPGISMVDLSAMVIAAVLLLPLAWTGKILKRWEGLLLLSGYGLYLWWLWPSS